MVMMLCSLASHQDQIDQAAAAWICSFSWTHALTLTYPLPKSPAGQGTTINGATGEVQTVPGIQSFADCHVPHVATSSDHALRRHLRLLSARVDGALFGSRFDKKPLRDRTNFFGFPSGTQPGCMFHVHMVWCVPESRWETFENLFADGAPASPWRTLVAYGTHKLKRIHDLDGWINYCTRQSSWQDMIISQELVPTKQWGSSALAG